MGKEREQLKCWGFGKPHLLREFLHNLPSIQNIQAIHELTTINDVFRNIPRINTTLEDKHAKHQSTTIEIEGTILNQSISILIDPRASLSYIRPQNVENVI